MRATAQRYLESQVLTASPEQLVVILYDGAIRFCRRAEDAFNQSKADEAGEILIRAQRVVLELVCALRPEASPDIVKNLGGLYAFVYEQLVWANVERDVKRIQDAVSVLETLREGWSGAIEKTKGKGSEETS